MSDGVHWVTGSSLGLCFPEAVNPRIQSAVWRGWELPRLARAQDGLHPADDLGLAGGLGDIEGGGCLSGGNIETPYRGSGAREQVMTGDPAGVQPDNDLRLAAGARPMSM